MSRQSWRSGDYMKLLRGEMSAAEYVRRLRLWVQSSSRKETGS